MPMKKTETVDQQTKNFLTENEMKKFLNSARQGRHGVRDFCLMLVCYRHGLRVSELIDIRLKDLDLETGRIYVRRCCGHFDYLHRWIISFAIFTTIFCGLSCLRKW